MVVGYTLPLAVGAGSIHRSNLWSIDSSCVGQLMGAGRFPKGRVEGMRILHAVAVMCDPARAMLFARIVLILAKMSTIKCPLKANGRGQSIPHLVSHALGSREHRAVRGSQKLQAVLGSPLELKLLYSDYLSVIPVSSPGPPLRLAARSGRRGGVCAGNFN